MPCLFDENGQQEHSHRKTRKRDEQRRAHASGRGQMAAVVIQDGTAPETEDADDAKCQREETDRPDIACTKTPPVIHSSPQAPAPARANDPATTMSARTAPRSLLQE